jgi:hypothetical protein
MGCGRLYSKRRHVVAIEGVVVGDAEDVPSSIVESVWLVVVVMVQAVFPHARFFIPTFTRSLVPGSWSMDLLYT